MLKTKFIISLSILLIIPSLVMVAFAHPGRTDGSGGHTDHSTGEYHYHHGQSAHDHYDIDGDGDLDCPYDFDDNTEHRSNSGQSTNEDSVVKKDSVVKIGGIIAGGLYLLFMFVLPFLSK